MEGKSLQQEVKATNDLDTGEEGRLVLMHVSRVSAVPPEEIVKRRRRHVSPRIFFFSRQDAKTAIEILQHGLDRNLPGTIGLMVRGREEL